MSDFEKELREARERQRREEEARHRASEEAIRQQQLNAQREESLRKDVARRKYQTYVLPVKPMVDRLLDDLARQTWGNGYGRDFSGPGGDEDSGASLEKLAYWVVGRTRSQSYSSWTGFRYRWHASLKEVKNWYESECFGVGLEKMGDGATRFNVGGRLLLILAKES